ncbi:MAG: murein biosynthesis integral membrane protein MurJ [Firmicutes bacterium]|nr:murein biosynthesis integral membrane protein MurJ [Bacillota bacterium]
MNKSLKNITLIVIIITIISKGLGFIREMVLSYFYGASMVSDAFLIALTIPSVVTGFVITGLSTSYIPIFFEINEKHGRDNALYLTNNIINVYVVISSVVCAICLVFAEPIVKLFALGFQGEGYYLAVKFSRILMASMIFTGMIAVFNAFLQIKNNFVVPALMGLPLNIFYIVAIYFSVKVNVILLPLISLFGFLAQVLILMFFMRRNGYKHNWIMNFRDKSLIRVKDMMIPTVASASFTQINIVVDKTLASGIAVGGISILNYAGRVNSFIIGIFVTSITTIMYPKISKAVINNEHEDIKSIVENSLFFVLLIVVPASAGGIFYSKEIIDVLFNRGAFDLSALNMTALSFAYYLIGSISQGIREIILRIFYSRKNTKTPMKISFWGILINIVLSVLLSKIMGLGGIAIATSISTIAITFVMVIVLYREFKFVNLKTMVVIVMKIAISTMVMICISSYGFENLIMFQNKYISLMVTIFLAVIVYFVMMFICEIRFRKLVIKNK